MDTPAAHTGFEPPGTKLYSPQLQAKLLYIMAAVLSQPDGCSTVLAACPQLPRLLLHMFAAPSAVLKTDTDVAREESGSGTAATAAAGAAGKAAPGTATAVAAAPTAAGATAAKAGAQTPRGSLAVNMKGAAAPGAQVSASGAATPRKTTMAPGAGAALSKVCSDPVQAWCNGTRLHLQSR